MLHSVSFEMIFQNEENPQSNTWSRNSNSLKLHRTDSVSEQRYFLGLLYFAHWMYQCAIYAQDLRKILSQCAIYAQDSIPIRKICVRLYFFPRCAIYAQDCTSFSNEQYMCKIVVISPMCNICARLAQDCTSFFNAQYMHKICARLYLFLQCARFAQDSTSFSNAQYMCKIVVISPMCNICTRFAKDCSYFSNAQYFRKICTRLYLFPQCAIYAQNLCKIVLNF